MCQDSRSNCFHCFHCFQATVIKGEDETRVLFNGALIRRDMHTLERLLNKGFLKRTVPMQQIIAAR